MKFLVLWRFEIAGLRSEMIQAIARMPDYAAGLIKQGKLVARYHIVGTHGGAWIYDVLPLAEMDTPAGVMRPAG
jgi:hypothetical protein